jgi:hypothetical protein
MLPESVQPVDAADSLRATVVVAQAEKPGTLRLDQDTLVTLLLAIVGIALLGVCMVVAVALGGRYVRRNVRRRPQTPQPSQEVPRRAGGVSGLTPEEIPDAATTETVAMPYGSGGTDAPGKPFPHTDGHDALGDHDIR